MYMHIVVCTSKLPDTNNHNQIVSCALFLGIFGQGRTLSTLKFNFVG